MEADIKIKYEWIDREDWTKKRWDGREKQMTLTNMNEKGVDDSVTVDRMEYNNRV